MKRTTIHVSFVLLMAVNVCAAVRHEYQAQSLTPQQQAVRDATREKVRTLLNAVGPKIDVSFRQSDKQPYNFVGIMKQGLNNTDSLEIIISVSGQETIHFRIFPHYGGGYLNVDKVNNRIELMRNLLLLSDTSSFNWGIDETGDIFAGYNFTLESGFPDAALTTVLRSIRNVDKVVGDMKPIFNG